MDEFVDAIVGELGLKVGFAIDRSGLLSKGVVEEEQWFVREQNVHVSDVQFESVAFFHLSEDKLETQDFDLRRSKRPPPSCS